MVKQHVKVLAFILATLTARGSLAESPQEAGKRHFTAGMAAFNEHRFKAAAREFEEGYRVDAKPAFLFNLGQAHRMANHPEQAIHYYEQYLSVLPNAPERAEVEQHIASLRQAKSATAKATRTAAAVPAIYPPGVTPPAASTTVPVANVATPPPSVPPSAPAAPVAQPAPVAAPVVVQQPQQYNPYSSPYYATTPIYAPPQPIKYIRQPMWGLFGAGIAIFLASYILDASISYGIGGDATGFIPLAGPILQMNQNYAIGTDAANLLLICDFAFQIIGVTFAILGISIWRKTPVRAGAQLLPTSRFSFTPTPHGMVFTF